MNESTPWAEMSLGESLAAIKDGTHGSFHRTDIGIPFLSAKNVGNDGRLHVGPDDDLISEVDYRYISRAFAPAPGDVLLTIVGSIGRAAIYEGERVAFQRSVAYLRANPRSVESRFLYHLVSSGQVQRQLVSRSNATAQAGVYLGEVAKIVVSLPPLEEQRRIAEILDALDNQILGSEHVLQKLVDVRSAVVEDALNGDDAIAVEPLGALANVSSGVTLGSEPGGAGTVTRPYLRVANVQDGHLNLSDIKSVRVRGSDLQRFELAPGDVLMNEGGDADKLGRGTVWEGQIPGCLHQNHVFKVRCLPTRLDPWYLALLSGSPRGKRYFLGASKQTTNLATINSTQIKAFPVPLRSIGRQQEIVASIRAVSRRVSVEAARLDKLRVLKLGLMSDLLTGRVRVPAEATL
jgi:type I restriction enzyme, S subunit